MVVRMEVGLEGDLTCSGWKPGQSSHDARDGPAAGKHPAKMSVVLSRDPGT